MHVSNLISKLKQSKDLKRFINLMALRCLSLAVLLIFNFLLLKQLSFEDVGLYYLITTVSYFGNALIFVGSDMYIQAKISAHLQAGFLNKIAISDFVLKVTMVGFLLVLSFSSLYFLYNPKFEIIKVSFICAMLSIVTFFLAFLKNAYQISSKYYIVSLMQFIDVTLKLSSLFFCTRVGCGSPLDILFAYIILAFALSIVSYWYLMFSMKNIESEPYFSGFIQLYKRTLPVGLGGLFNWIQLLSYRPILSINSSNLMFIGSISFLTNIGSTATNAFMYVISQLWIPRIYATKGVDTKPYLIRIFIFGVLLSVLSIPAAWLFIQMTGKDIYLSVLYLVPVGVVQETLNSMIGALAIHYTIRAEKLSAIPTATAFGALVVLVLLYMQYFYSLPLIPVVAFALIFSQMLVFLWLILSAKRVRIL